MGETRFFLFFVSSLVLPLCLVGDTALFNWSIIFSLKDFYPNKLIILKS